MKTSTAVIATAGLACAQLAAAQTTAATNGLTIQTPPSLVQCQPVAITFSGGTAPYFIAVIPGGQVTAAAIEQFPTQNTAGQFTWTVNIAAGQTISLKITDGAGDVNYSQVDTIQSSPDSSCLTASASSGSTSGSGSTTASSSASSASSGASSASSGASSASSGASSASSSSSSGASTPAPSTPTPAPTTGSSSSSAAATTSTSSNGANKGAKVGYALLAIGAAAAFFRL